MAACTHHQQVGIGFVRQCRYHLRGHALLHQQRWHRPLVARRIRHGGHQRVTLLFKRPLRHTLGAFAEQVAQRAERIQAERVHHCVASPGSVGQVGRTVHGLQ